jgi:uncharacterized protein (TIGR02246 family)
MEEVAQTMGDYTEALNSHDPDRILSFYRQDPSFLYLGCTDILSGWGTFESRVRPYYTVNTDVTFQQQIINIQVLGPTTATVALRGGSSEAPNLFWTMALQKGEGGRWLITQEHESWPGCRVPRGPHMGTGGDPSQEMMEAGPGTQGS